MQAPRRPGGRMWKDGEAHVSDAPGRPWPWTAQAKPNTTTHPIHPPSHAHCPWYCHHAIPARKVLSLPGQLVVGLGTPDDGDDPKETREKEIGARGSRLIVDSRLRREWYRGCPWGLQQGPANTPLTPSFLMITELILGLQALWAPCPPLPHCHHPYHTLPPLNPSNPPLHPPPSPLHDER